MNVRAVLCLFFVSSQVIACDEMHDTKQLTVCDIRKNPSAFRSQNATFRAVLKSDQRHFSYLIDYACGKTRNSIGLGQYKDEAVYKPLYDKWNGECAGRGEAGLCVFEKLVEVSGAIRESDDGLVIDIYEMAEVDSPVGK